MRTVAQEIIFLYGPPAAGKSTFAKYYAESHPDFCRIGADDVRLDLYGSSDSYGNPEEIYAELLRRMRVALDEGKSILYDAVNMRKSYRIDFLAELSGYNIAKTIIQLPTAKSVCLERFLRRKRTIPIKSVEHYFTMDERPTYEEGWDNIHTCCTKAYIASPFFEDSHRAAAIAAANILRDKGIDTYLPLEHKVPNAWDYKNYEWGHKVFSADIQAIEDADTVVVLSYGRIASAGTNFEAGYAYGRGKRVIVVEMPEVTLMSLMVANGRHATVKGLEGLAAYDFVTMPMLEDRDMEQK